MSLALLMSAFWVLQLIGLSGINFQLHSHNRLEILEPHFVSAHVLLYDVAVFPAFDQ